MLTYVCNRFYRFFLLVSYTYQAVIPRNSAAFGAGPGDCGNVPAALRLTRLHLYAYLWSKELLGGSRAAHSAALAGCSHRHCASAGAIGLRSPGHGSWNLATNFEYSLYGESRKVWGQHTGTGDA